MNYLNSSLEKLIFEDEEDIWLSWNKSIYRPFINKYEMELKVPFENNEKMDLIIRGTPLNTIKNYNLDNELLIWTLQIKSSIGKTIKIGIGSDTCIFVIELTNTDIKKVFYNFDLGNGYVNHMNAEFVSYKKTKRYINIIKFVYDQLKNLLTVFLNDVQIFKEKKLHLCNHSYPLIIYYDDNISIRIINAYKSKKFPYSLQSLCKNIVFHNKSLTQKFNELPHHVTKCLI